MDSVAKAWQLGAELWLVHDPRHKPNDGYFVVEGAQLERFEDYERWARAGLVEVHPGVLAAIVAAYAKNAD